MPLPAILVSGLASLLLRRLGAGADASRESQYRDMILKLFSPEALGAEGNSIFSLIKRSPLYSRLQANAIGGTNALSSSLARSFALRGLNTSGIAGVAQPLAASSFGNTMMGIDSDLFQKALSLARDNLSSKASFLMGRPNVPSVGAGTLGGLLSDMTPQIYDYIKGLNWDSPQVKAAKKLGQIY